MTPPPTIIIKSDDNEITYRGCIKSDKGILYQYEYTKSKTKRFQMLYLTEELLTKLIKNNT